MTTEGDEVPVGDAAVLRRFTLPTLWLARTSSVGGGATREERRPDGLTHVRYPRAYDPGDATVDHLTFP